MELFNHLIQFYVHNYVKDVQINNHVMHVLMDLC